MEEIMNGTVIKLDEDSNEKFVVIDDIVKDGKQYVLLHPFELKEEEEVVELDYEKMTLIELKAENDFEYVTDNELVKTLVEEMLSK